MTDAEFRAALEQAALAPSVHNTQPARWRLADGEILLGCDLGSALAVGDPVLAGAGLSCGAAAEAMVLALSAQGIGADVTDLWAGDDRTVLPGCRMAARIVPRGGVAPDALAEVLPVRFTHRGAFGPVATLGDWTRDDMVAVTQQDDRAWIAALNDTVSLRIMRQTPFRRELLHWMRLSPRHPRHGIDGMSREALRMSARAALAARLTLGPLWRICDRLGLSAGMTAEAGATLTAPLIAAFHRPSGESPVTSGRAYLRLWLQATARGMAGWPMAALSDDPGARAQVCERLRIGDDRRLVQVIRFGAPTAPPPPRARRPLDEVIVQAIPPDRGLHLARSRTPNNAAMTHPPWAPPGAL